MKGYLDTVSKELGISWFDYQMDYFQAVADDTRAHPRTCLYYKTGAGKTVTSLMSVGMWGHDDALVIAPPITHDMWVETGARMGLEIECMSHAKFRMKDTRLERTKAIIADEMHLFGGHGGKGWKKLDTLALHLKAPLVLASATPNYNDADRVYCIQHVLDPHSCKGGFLEFLYANCETEQNPFSTTPYVLGFRGFPDAAAYLAALPHVHYLPDDLVYTIKDTCINSLMPIELQLYGLNERRERIIASQMEERHALVDLTLVGDDGGLRLEHWWWLEDKINKATTPVLVFTQHSSVAEALGKLLLLKRYKSFAVLTGKTPKKAKAAIIQAFKEGRHQVLIGTATLATGTDGLDKVCDTLVILDDTDDDSLRRQLIGRIMPRGAGGDASKKRVHRLVLL